MRQSLNSNLDRAARRRAARDQAPVPALSARGPKLPAACGHWLVHLTLILAVGLAAYATTFDAPFLFDDQSSIAENPVIKDLGRFLTGDGYRYNPRRFVGYLTFALNYHFGGLDVAGYHLVNFAIHVCCAWLVYALARVTLRTPRLAEIPRPQAIALLAALLFVAHPVQTQAVTYIVQRLASLATLFFLLSVVLYAFARLKQGSGIGDRGSVDDQGPRTKDQGQPLKAGSGIGDRGSVDDQGPRTRDKGQFSTFLCFTGSFLAAIAAMKTKEIAFTLPFVILLYEFTFFGGGWKKRLAFAAPLLATVVVLPLTLLRSGRPLGELLSDVSDLAKETDLISRHDYFLTQLRVIATYVRLLLWPADQNLDYDYPVYTRFFEPAVLLSFLLIAALLALALWGYGFRFQVSGLRLKTKDKGQRTKDQGLRSTQDSAPSTQHWRLIAFGILWFFLTLAVESSVIPIRDVIFEHRLYLPLAGAALAAAAAFFLLLGRFPARVWGALALIVVLALSLATYRRNLVWADAITLWQDVVAKAPRKARAHSELGNALRGANRPAEAIRHLETAIALRPGYMDAYNNLGAAYFDTGHLEGAIATYRQGLRLQPNRKETHNNLGAAYDAQGRFDLALEEYRLVLEMDPGHLSARSNLGMAYFKLGRLEEARAEYLRVLARDPDHVEARINLGVVYDQEGALEEAIAEYLIALALKPGQVQLHSNLGVAYHRQGRLAEAMEEYRAALRLRPDHAMTYNNLGTAYLDQKDFDQAIAHYRKALALEPATPRFANNLARALRMQDAAH